MKRILTLFMLFLLCFSLLVACNEAGDSHVHTWDEGVVSQAPTPDKDGVKTYICTECKASKRQTLAFDGIDKDTWLDAIAEHLFNNVTINYTFEDSAKRLSRVVRISGSKLYEDVTTVSGMGSKHDTLLLTSTRATAQRKLYLDAFRILLAEYESFTWSKEGDIYLASDEVTVRVPRGEEGDYMIETLKNGRVKFGTDGRVLSFSGTLTEAVYDANGVAGAITSGEVCWNFTDYGATTIPMDVERGE